MRSFPVFFYHVTFLVYQLFWSLWPVVDGVTYGGKITNYNPLICNSVSMCATSPPLNTLSVSSKTSCTQKCHFLRYQPAPCVGYNFRPVNNSCEIYTDNPSNFRMNSIGCKYFQSSRTGPNVPAALNCSTLTVINDCQATYNGGCDLQATCSKPSRNQITCVCKVGYIGTGFICNDIDECATNNGGCSQNATCYNTAGSFTCSCKTGFTGNGVNCTRTPTLVAQWTETAGVYATALLKDQLFVTRNGANQVSVYNTSSFQLIRIITFSGLGTILYGLATSAVDNGLYVSDHINQRVHRVDLSVTSTVSVVTWSVPNYPHELSITSENTVLVAMYGGTISEYAASGSLVRMTRVSNTPVQAVQVNNTVLAYIATGTMNTLCTIMTSGTVIKCSTLAMNNPVSITINTSGYMLVADTGNNRVLVVDPTLTSARELQLPVTPAVQSPSAFSYVQSLGRLYFGENGGRNRVLVFDGIQW